MYLHFLHLERIKLLLDPLSECRGEPAPCRWLAAAVVHARRERVIHTQVAGKRQSLRRRRSGAVGKGGGELSIELSTGALEFRFGWLKSVRSADGSRSFILLKRKRREEGWSAERGGRVP
jgi:hypothetical protein